MPKPADLLQDVIAIADDAAAGIRRVYDAHDDIESVAKADDSPLTEADMAAHRLIDARLRRLTPDIPVLSEESADQISWEQRRGWQRYWLVDPLDGTKEFIKKNGEFTVNIALISDHRPVLGVVHVPAQETVYYAAEGKGAFRQRPGEAAKAIHVRRLGDGPVTVVASRSHRSEAVDAFVKALGDCEITSVGSSLKLCRVAEGSADVYPRLGPTSEWDTAAAQAVVEMAGGHVTDVEGRPLRYNRGESVLNPHFLVFGDDSRDWAALVPPSRAHRL